MADRITARTIAVVGVEDIRPGDFIPCDSRGEIDRAVEEITVVGGEPVVFWRKGHARHVVNSVVGNVTGSFIQAGVVHGVSIG